MKMNVFLKGGGSFAVDVESFKTERHPITNELIRIVWAPTKDANVRLNYINVGEIAAVVAECSEEEMGQRED